MAYLSVSAWEEDNGEQLTLLELIEPALNFVSVIRTSSFPKHFNTNINLNLQTIKCFPTVGIHLVSSIFGIWRRHFCLWSSRNRRPTPSMAGVYKPNACSRYRDAKWYKHSSSSWLFLNRFPGYSKYTCWLWNTNVSQYNLRLSVAGSPQQNLSVKLLDTAWNALSYGGYDVALPNGYVEILD